MASLQAVWVAEPRRKAEREIGRAQAVLPGTTDSLGRSTLADEYSHFLDGDQAEGLLENHTRLTMDRLACGLVFRGKAR